MHKMFGILAMSLAAMVTAEQLEISVSNITNAKGTVFVAIFDKPDYWLDSKAKEAPFRDAAYAVSSTDNASIIIKDIPAGSYAISIFHDLNANKKLDTNFIGFPKEPFGFSKPMGKFGPPKFDEAKIAVGSGVTKIEIGLQ